MRGALPERGEHVVSSIEKPQPNWRIVSGVRCRIAECHELAIRVDGQRRVGTARRRRIDAPRGALPHRPAAQAPALVCGQLQRRKPNPTGRIETAVRYIYARDDLLAHLGRCHRWRALQGVQHILLTGEAGQIVRPRLLQCDLITAVLRITARPATKGFGEPCCGSISMSAKASKAIPSAPPTDP